MPDETKPGLVKVLVKFFEHPIEVSEEEAASLRRQGLTRDDDKPAAPAAGPSPTGTKEPVK